ncbi:midasin [Dorcoceras hygrometricum]|uniref:Midasin n=1 Tax=Dorcoceras hygrometricum TaxID=472368 RepID=A0A2Z7CFR8_9LAMI|nr:midasin [Dorcoceras hygrometricum]
MVVDCFVSVFFYTSTASPECSSTATDSSTACSAVVRFVITLLISCSLSCRQIRHNIAQQLFAQMLVFFVTALRFNYSLQLLSDTSTTFVAHQLLSSLAVRSAVVKYVITSHNSCSLRCWFSSSQHFASTIRFSYCQIHPQHLLPISCCLLRIVHQLFALLHITVDQLFTVLHFEQRLIGFLFVVPTADQHFSCSLRIGLLQSSTSSVLDFTCYQILHFIRTLHVSISDHLGFHVSNFDHAGFHVSKFDHVSISDDRLLLRFS